MAHARRLTRDEKIFLTKEGYVPKKYLRLKKTKEFYRFIETSTGKILTLGR